MDHHLLHDFYVQLSLGVLGVLLAVYAIIYVLLLVLTKKTRPLLPSERNYIHLKTEDWETFPQLTLPPTPASASLSVVVPAYNETKRLEGMLKSTVDYLEQRRKQDGKFTYEIIVVDDGSSDGTSDLVLKLAKQFFHATREQCHLRLLKFEKNRGKGGAVKHGIICSSGSLVLFADADNATKFSDIEKLEQKLQQLQKEHKTNAVCVVGSRAHLVATEAVVQRSAVRNLLMYAFHLAVWLLTTPGVHHIKDTQCGFKLFTREAAARVFPCLHVEGWIFDIEVLHLCVKQGIPVGEVAVNWHEVDGTKMSLVRDSIRMALDLFVIRFNYLLGRWRVGGKEKKG